jgi:putative nucleotidyltransferase with HDIG domain
LSDLPQPLAVLAAADTPGWLVGGAVRDRLLGRPTTDYDVAIVAEPRTLARKLARSASGHAFALSEGFGAWRVVARDHSWQVDLLRVLGDSIEADLALRDLTVNALAEPLLQGDLIDPFGGLEDLRRRRVRMVSAGAFANDPLRVLRVARLACELRFSVEPETAAAARGQARGLASVAPERVFSELKRILGAPEAVSGIRLMDELEVTDVVLPELVKLRGVEQSRFHHLDVHSHTLAVLQEAIDLERNPEGALGADAAEIDRYLSAPLADDLTRWQALRWGALLHDVAKPQTRAITPEGRVTFMGHDAAGAETARAVLGRLRASSRLIEHVAGLVINHLRLGFLVAQRPLSRRTIYRYLRACAPVGVDVTVLSVADRLATRGDRSDEAIARHLEVARQMAGEALSWAAAPPRPPVRGDQIVRALGVKPGPQLGHILAELEEASFAEEIGSAQEAMDRARQLLGADG